MTWATSWLGATAVEEALDRDAVVGAVGVGRPYWPVAKRPMRQRAPDAAAPWTAHGADRVVDAQVLDEVDDQRDDDAGDGADDDRAARGHPVAGAVMATRPPRKPLIAMPTSHFLERG